MRDSEDSNVAGAVNIERDGVGSERSTGALAPGRFGAEQGGGPASAVR